jgi:Predicted ATPase involved in replication control, Cdc46/Mcm family
VKVGIEPPLLSRFDLIFKLIDGSDAKKDDNVATFLLNRAIQGSGYDCARSSNNAGSKQLPWNMDKLCAYIATVKSYFHPTISDGASRLLERHYSECRSSEYMEFQVTVRLLESLIRLSQAHARLMHRNIDEVLDDAVAVILLMECSVASTSSSNFNVLFKDPATTVFPEEDGAADIKFVLDKKKVLEKYDMLEYLTKDDLDVIKNHDADQHRSSHFDDWDALKANQSMYSPSEHCSLPNHGSGPNRYTLVTLQDHYGRFTQSTSASPPFNDTDWNCNSEWHYNNTIGCWGRIT